MDNLHLLIVGNNSDVFDFYPQNELQKCQIKSMTCEEFSTLSEEKLEVFQIIFLGDCSATHNKMNLLQSVNKTTFTGILILLIDSSEIEIGVEAIRNGADAIIFKHQLNSDLLKSLLNSSEGKEENNFTSTAARNLEEDRALITAKMNMATAYADNLSSNLINLLTVVTMNADITLMKIEADHSVRKELSAILTISDKIMAINNQLMSIGTTQRFFWQMIELNSLLSDTECEIKKLCGNTAKLEFDLADDLELIAANDLKMQALVFNLVKNAFESFEQEGKITIRSRNVALENNTEMITDSSVSGQFVMLEIEDNGCGICGVNFIRIFDPFYTTKFNAHNAGLGLSEVWGIVKQAEGHLAIDSAPGLGTRVRIYFPAMKLK